MGDPMAAGPHSLIRQGATLVESIHTRKCGRKWPRKFWPQTMIEEIDLLWLVIASALVFVMQAGFLCLETGMTRSKNNINVAIKNFCDFIICTFVCLPTNIICLIPFIY